MKIKTGKLQREASFDRATVNEEGRTVELSFSSEDPYERYFGIEILDHSPKSVRLKRLKKNGPLLMDHNSRDQIGIIESVSIGEDRKGRAIVRFGKSARAEEVFQDVLDGIRGNVSVGYMIHKMKQEEVNKDTPDVFRAVDWEPLEVSLVSVPADITVGVGRDNQGDHETEVIDIPQENQMLIGKKNLKKFDADKGDAEGGGSVVAEKAKPSPVIEVNVDEIRQEATRLETERIREITAIGEKIGVKSMAKKFIEDGKSIDAFREAVVEGMGAEPVTDATPEIGLSKKETQQFSILRAVNSIAQFGDLRNAPFEAECSEAVQDRFNKESLERGFSVPFEVQNQKMDLRDLTVGTATAGGNLVATELMSASFIDLLRNLPLVTQMGAQVLDGLIGDIAIPRQTGGASVFWVAESVDPTESQQTFDQVAMTPKTIGAFTDISRKLLLQSSIDIENLVRMDLATVVALEIDRVAIDGSGAGAEPTGILQTAGIGAVAVGVNGGPPTWQHMVDLEKEVAKDNAALGALGYLTNSDVAAKLKTVQKGTNLPFIMQNSLSMTPPFGEVNGYRTGITNQVANNGTKGTGVNLSDMIFANWRDLLIGYWGAIDVLVDPYTGGLAGTLRLRILRDTDINVRHPESFSAMTDIETV